MREDLTIEEALAILLAALSRHAGPEAGPDPRQAAAAMVQAHLLRVAQADGRTRSQEHCEDVVSYVLIRLLGTRPRQLQRLEEARATPDDWPELVDRAAFYGACDPSIAQALGLSCLPDDLALAAAAARERLRRTAKSVLRRAVQRGIIDLFKLGQHIDEHGQKAIEVTAVDTQPAEPGSSAVVVEDRDADIQGEVELRERLRRMEQAERWLDGPGLEAFAGWQEARSPGSGQRRVEVLLLLHTLNRQQLSLKDHIGRQHPHLSDKDLAAKLTAVYSNCRHARTSLIEFVQSQRGDAEHRRVMREALVVIDRRYRIHKRAR